VVSGITLAIDAATYSGTVAVIRDGAVVAADVVAMRGETEERLMPTVMRAIGAAGLAVTDVQRVVCGAGPGSFTSLRIAGAIAKGVAFGNGVPLFPVSSLALIVAAADDLPAGEYLAVLDAMRGDRYVAPFRRRSDGRVVAAGAPALVAASEVIGVAAAGGATILGPGDGGAAPHARGAVRMLTDIVAAGPAALDAWEPTYGRLAEAQVKWEAAHGRPLDT
jgi:tRNA threonylcarbamoyladenosine biosynthesis protein TsaB